ncbi:MAG: Stk1 family PASTA domain-containing Ser/Thr kinase [Peptostreptococcaceae bacterium]|nr:Stk1 family PASTA domain-containing Ser/Thr kinase [Peptostreptococcaceae bacterium]
MIGKILGNRYEIVEKIGEGGMAKVYKAKCNLLNRFVAVKILKNEYVNNKEFTAKFNSESQSAAKLSHPNIVNIYDIGIEGDINYIIMEYIDGITLKDSILKNAPFDNAEIIEISSQIAAALAHAHKNKIIHRDIKPQNILFTKDNRIKVADFGIARAVTDATVVNASNLMGTVHYASPEQLKGSLVDERTDIYSLGVIMYEMSTGQLPYDGEAPITVALKHMNEVLIPPNLVNKKILGSLNSIILKTMNKTAAYRYDSAQSLIKDLSISGSGKIDIYNSDFDSGKTTVLPLVKERKKPGKQSGNTNKKNKKSQKHIYSLAILSGLILSILFTIFSSYAFFKGDLFKSEVTIPTLINMPFSEAKSILLENGLDYVVFEEKYDHSIASGNIIIQEPAADEIVKEGYTVKLTVSLGKVKTMVPNLLNLTNTEAIIAIENNNLAVGDVEYVYDDLPIDTVIKQLPEAGELVDETTPINLILSQGLDVKTFMMPNLIGKTVESAKNNLAELGISLANVKYETNKEIEKDRIISQSVSSGSEISQNTSISLVVSDGSELIDDKITKTMMIPLSFSSKEAQVKVVMTHDGTQTIVFENPVKKSEKILSLEIEGNGKALVEVFFDGILAFSQEENFE